MREDSVWTLLAGDAARPLIRPDFVGPPSPASGRRGARDSDGGFTLIEVSLALLLIAFLAALALPGLFRSTGPALLRATAMRTSAVLREDRVAAMNQGRIVATTFSYDGVRSGFSNSSVRFPTGTVLTAPPAIKFSPDGHSTGGNIVITYARARMVLNVSPDSGAIRVRAQ